MEARRKRLRARLVAELLSLQEARLRAVLKEVLVVASSVGALGVSARLKFYIPISPVPFTLQTLVLTYLVLALGRKAWRAVLAYLLGGLAGLPLFAHGGGPLYVLSPTFGYLLGFLVGALIGGWIVGEGGLMPPRRLLIACTSVLLATYILGALHLALWFKLFRGLGILEALGLALLTGVLPFILWDAMKAYIAFLLYILTIKALRTRKKLKL